MVTTKGNCSRSRYVFLCNDTGPIDLDVAGYSFAFKM